MSIDWITVSAQIINFLILVWLLKRVLYQPVIRAMDQREQRVTQRLKDADEREQLAEQQRAAFHAEQAELERNRNLVIKQAEQEADTIKHELLNSARDEVAEIRHSWQQQVEAEKAQFLESLQQKTTTSVLGIARKTLLDLADADLQTQTVSAFIERLKTLTPQDAQRLAQAPEPLAIKTAFNLSPPLQDRLCDAIESELKITAEPFFHVVPAMGLGIELNAGEQRLVWNLDSYLEQLDAELKSALAGAHTSE